MANLNYEKLYKSDFTDRLLDFVKEYEKARHITFYDDVVNWIIEEKTDCIKSFLSSQSIGYFEGINTLLNKKRALYEEFVSFYE